MSLSSESLLICGCRPERCACPIPITTGKYGDEDTMDAMEKFRKFYEDKMKEIDIEGGGDCLELKLKLQERWIKDLTEQTEMMAKIVKELEEEATARVRMLEEKLKQTSKAAYEKVFYMENDLKNIMEFIRRIREEGKWSIEGLQFYEITHNDLFGKNKNENAEEPICEFGVGDAPSIDAADAVPFSNGLDLSENNKGTVQMNEKEKSFFYYESLLKKQTEDYENLRQSMLDMRSALTEEVACKHDMISALKKDVQQLEERCVQADKQTAFKDDIIKELRKEIKQLKSQLKKENDESKAERIEELEKKLKDAEAKIRRMRPCVDMRTACTAMDDLVSEREKKKKQKERDLENEITCRQREVDSLKCKCAELEKALNCSQERSKNLQKAESSCDAKNELKKLRHQKRCYEHILECFKHEMGVMSEQLASLQEILNLSNKSCKEENSQLYNALANLHQVSDKLQNQLVDAERKALVESHLNQLKDVKIDELQSIIERKNADLNIHDEAINEMRQRLEDALLKNHELQAKIISLDNAATELRCQVCPDCLRNKEKSKTTPKKSAEDLQAELDKKEKKLNKLHNDYLVQFEILKTLQSEFEKVKEKNKDKIKNMKRQNEELKEKLDTTEDKNKKLINEVKKLKDHTTALAGQDCNKEHELVLCKQVVLDIRQTLIELNDNLAESELHQRALAEEFHQKMQEDRQHEDIFRSCQCEIILYKKLVQNLKDMFSKMKKNLMETEIENRSLHDELKRKDMKLGEIQKRLNKKEKEASHHIREISQKLKESQEEERRLSEFIEKLKNEIQMKIAQQSNEAKRVISCHCEMNRQDMTATQEEISSLKTEIKKMIHNQLALNNENDKLLKQVTELQTTVNSLEDKNQHLKQKLDKLQSENSKLKDKNNCLMREKEAAAQTIKNLEMELAEARNNRDDVCAESKNVVSNVKAWLEEQRKINDKIKKRTQCYCSTIEQLKEENRSLQSTAVPVVPVQVPVLKPSLKNTAYRSFSPPPPTSSDECPGPWCYGSQGVSTPRDSPSSFVSCSVDEWYAPNYRDETDIESDDEFVNRLEAVTNEMRNNNKKWKKKHHHCECLIVSRDNN